MNNDIAERFQCSISKLMTELNLQTKSNAERLVTHTRSRIRTGVRIQVFSSLPVTTKIRYLKFRLGKKMCKIKLILRILQSQKSEKFIGNENKGWRLVMRNLSALLKAEDMQHFALIIREMLEDEREEWVEHVEALDFRENQKKQSICQKKGENNSKVTSTASFETAWNNFTLDVDCMKIINTVLSASGCNHHFRNEGNNSHNLDYLSKDCDNWKDHLTRAHALLREQCENNVDSYL